MVKKTIHAQAFKKQPLVLLECIPRRGQYHRCSCFLHCGQELLIGWFVAAIAIDDYPLRLKTCIDEGEAVVVVLVRMGDNQVIESPDPFSPEIRGDDALAGIELLRLITAAIDQDILAIGKLQEGGRALADIEEADGKFLAVVRVPEGKGK